MIEGGGANGAAVIEAVVPPARSGTATCVFPVGGALYLDGSITPIAGPDAPVGMAVDPDYFLYVFETMTDPGCSIRMEHAEFGLDMTLVESAGGDLHIPLTGMTREMLTTADGSTALVTLTNDASGPGGVNSVRFGNDPPPVGFEYSGTYALGIPTSRTPNISAGPDKFVTPPLPDEVVVTGSFEHAPPSGATITYHWEYVAGPAGATPPVISDPDSLETGIMFTERKVGGFVFRLTSSGDPDHGVPASSDTVTITIPAPVPPRIETIRRTVTP